MWKDAGMESGRQVRRNTGRQKGVLIRQVDRLTEDQIGREKDR